MASTVTIDRAYFETLLRRAELHTTGRDPTTPIDIPIVSIPKIDHDNLLRMVHEYTCLKQALLDGGIQQETLETLIRGQDSTNHANAWAGEETSASAQLGPVSRPTKVNVTLSRPVEGSQERSHSRWPPAKTHTGAGSSPPKSKWFNWRASGVPDETSFHHKCEKEEPNWTRPSQDKPRYEQHEQRTIIAKNLPEWTTHLDVANFVRGGSLLDIYLRFNDRSASISFVDGDAAQNFMSHVKRNDIYVRGKRIDFAWSERQFVLPRPVASKISTGATRNLVIRKPTNDITEKRLREDLDHIHNIAIVHITFCRGDVTISLNSVNNSIFAKSCLMSRATYKGFRIDWAPDECSQPLPRSLNHQKAENAQAPKKKHHTRVNRFQMLVNQDGTEEGSEDDDMDETSLTELSSLQINRQHPWASRTIFT